MRKNIFIFIAGMITILLLEFIIGFIIGVINQSEQDGACINAKQIKIFQTLEPNIALAHALTKPNAIFDENETLVLIIGDENAHYYDEQKINVPTGKCAKQIGTYQYPTKQDIYKTVPAVKIK